MDQMKSPIAYTRTIELRKSNRYHVYAPVRFCWAASNGLPRSGEGTTRDIDTTGAYINASELPPVRALVQLDIVLSNLSDGGPGAHLVGEGMVLRVDPQGNSNGNLPWGLESGFAVSVQFYLESSESVLTHLKSCGRVM
jgi:hypothetical protein